VTIAVARAAKSATEAAKQEDDEDNDEDRSDRHDVSFTRAPKWGSRGVAPNHFHNSLIVGGRIAISATDRAGRLFGIGSDDTMDFQWSTHGDWMQSASGILGAREPASALLGGGCGVSFGGREERDQRVVVRGFPCAGFCGLLRSEDEEVHAGASRCCYGATGKCAK